MSKESKQDFNTDWYKIWMQQSKEFFDITEKNLKGLFDKNDFVDPEKHREKIDEWLNALKRHWEFPLMQEQNSFQAYWLTIGKMYNEASELLLKEWIKRAHGDYPVKNFRDLYELWLNCCHEVYQRTLQSKAYQEVYGDFMNAALKFWQATMPK